MPQFDYTPDEEIQLNRANAIKLMCRPFASHDMGLPEWVKNSAAAYLREEPVRDDRVIVLFFCKGRGRQLSSISCLDFVGMTSEQIDRDFKVWADPDASVRASSRKLRIGELGGHGNGGKCYMTQMFTDHAALYTIRNGHASTYGVASGSVAFGYVPNNAQGRNIAVPNITARIGQLFAELRTNLEELPEALRTAADSATGCTLVRGIGPRDFTGRNTVGNLIESMLTHHQMITPLQQCQVYVVSDGEPLNGGAPLSLQTVEPMAGFEEPRQIDVPETLEDPVSGQRVSTRGKGHLPVGMLSIFTSDKNMRLGRGGRRVWRHTVNFHTEASGIIGKLPMQGLDVLSSYRDHMYCDCYLESLDEYKQNDRGALAESVLTRAVSKWIAERVQEYCLEFEARERRRVRQQDRNELSRINELLDHWKNKFMQEFMHGLYGPGEGRKPRTGDALPNGQPALINVSLSRTKAGVGVYFRPTIKFFDANGKRIRAQPFRWVSQDNNIAMVDEDLMLVQTFAHGATEIHAELLTGSLRSNAVPLEVVRIHKIQVIPAQIEMPSGTRRRLDAICQLPDGSETLDVYLTWIEGNSAVVNVSASGAVYAFGIGESEVAAMDDVCRSDEPARIIVTAADEGRGEGDQRGRGFPKILISEIQCAPGDNEPAQFRADAPPVYQRPIDVESNIWWINLASPFARLYSNTNQGYGVTSDAWRMYHVERLIDVIVHIALAHGPDGDDEMISTDWIQNAAQVEADIRTKAIESLAVFIASGDLKA